MRLAKLELNNFRSYRELNVDFQQDMNVIVGRNDVGKSTIMEALEIFFNNDLVKIDQSDLNNDAKKSGETLVTIKLSFTLNGNEDIIIDSTNPTNPYDEFLLNGTYLTLVKTFDCSKPIKATSIKLYIKCLYPSILADEPLINQTQSKLKKIITENDLEQFVQDNRINAQLRLAIYNHFLSEDDRNNLTPILIDLSKTSDDTKNLKSSIEKNLPLYFLFQSDRANKDSDKDVQNPLNIAIQKALIKPDIKTMLDEVERLVKEEIQEIGEATISKLNEMDPNIASSLNPDYSKSPEWKSVFKFSFTGDDIPINKRGSGVRRLILLNYFRAEADRQIQESNANDVIYAIEEPETSQHPDYQLMLIKALMELSETNQVLITTHTPQIAKMVDINSLIIIVKDSDGNIIEFENEAEKIEAIIQSLGILPDIKINDVPNVKVVVCLEGYTDIKFIENINQTIANYKNIIDIKNDPRVFSIPLGGSTLEHWVNNQYLKKLNIPEIHIYDADTNKSDPTQQNKYRKFINEINDRPNHDCAYETKKAEIENYIHPELIKNCYDIDTCYHRSEADWLSKWDINDVAKFINKNADKSNSIIEPISSERMAKKHLSSELSKNMTQEYLQDLEAFDEIEEWFNKINELANL
ncbi:MAG: AAA family ATPase [Thiovulaceae bacterium]|nr:AAA family ATPase [Sulfurimonadaceae bacterium]